MKNPLRVHICVVGFEIDRISEAAIRMKADKVYLISQEEGDKGREFLEENKRLLEEKNIEVIVELVESVHDLSVLLNIIKKIILEEGKDNYVFINISSGSTVSTIAGTISSMMFDKDRKIIPYYVKPEDYPENTDAEEVNSLLMKFNISKPPRSVGVKEIQEIPTFPMKLPNKELIVVLEYLQSSQNEGKYVTKKDLIEFSKDNECLKRMRENSSQLAGELEEKGKVKNSNKMDDESNQKYRDYAWLNQNIISKLKDEWNLIDIEKSGKFACVKLNEKGEKMLSYLNG
jgi:hypothetical protein